MDGESACLQGNILFLKIRHNVTERDLRDRLTGTSRAVEAIDVFESG